VAPGHWFLISLVVAAYTVLVGGHFWGGCLLLVIAVGRVVTLRSWRTLGVMVGVLLLMAGYLALREHQLKQRELSYLHSSPVSLRLRVQPDAISVRGAAYYLTARVATTGEPVLIHGRVKTAGELAALKRVSVPQLWVIRGQQQGILPATNFGQFDAAKYWRRRGIVKTIAVTELTSQQPAQSTLYGWFSDWWHSWRARLIHYCEGLPGALSVYALGLFPGQKRAETALELQGMRQLGLLHLFAISGMHVALLLGVLTWVLVHLRLAREHWEWLLLLGLPGYFILAGGGSGVLRACLMRGLQLFGKRIGRPIGTLDAWASALVGGLVLNPGLLFELGGQLSYGLSLALILLANERVHWRQVGLTLLSLPSLLSGVFQWHFLTLLANWVIVPLFPTVILPLTVVGTLSGHYLPLVSHWIANILGRFDELLEWFGKLPGNVVFGQPVWWLTWVWVALTWGLFTRPVAQRRRWICGLLASYGLAYGLIHVPFSGEVTYFDVGQGDSILIREPYNRRISLIDTGGRLGFREPDWVPRLPATYAATRTSLAYLRSRGITHIDDLYLTHHDADHIGDLPAFLQDMRVGRILVPAGMEREPSWQYLLHGSRVSVQPIKVGTVMPLKVLHPFEAALAENANSLALQGSFGGHNFLFMGDLDRPGEQKILDAVPQLRTDVLKLGHHGSKTASAPAFLAQTKPQWAIISAGRQNRYGHPNQETLATLSDLKIPAVSTQTSGMIRYSYHGTHGFWQTKLKGDQET